MVGKVLRNHQIVYKRQNVYRIEGFQLFSKQQIDELVALCEQKLEEYIKKSCLPDIGSLSCGKIPLIGYS